MKPELEDLLQQCTVKITVPGQVGWGTGFFVVPGLILTCAHVVKNLGSNGKASIRWQHFDDFAEAEIEQVVSHSDLALLRFKSPPNINNLPCVYLDNLETLNRPFQSGDELYCFGYPLKDFNDGCPITVTCEGGFNEWVRVETFEEGEKRENKEEVKIIKFKAGLIEPGVSGSALLNFRTGKICGIAKFTRDRLSPHGGGAISIDTILEKLPQLCEAQKQFHSRNSLWNNLLEADYAGKISTSKLEITKNLTDKRLAQYLITAIQSKPNKKIKNLEGIKILLKDLYVPLDIREDSSWNDVPTNTSIKEGISIHRWVKDLLLSGVDEIILIQGESGQGKTAFCEMFADEMSKEPNLDFIPILISLEDIKEIKENLGKTLKPCLECYEYFVDNHNWLSNTSLKFLILLDGFDELTFSTKEIKDFIEQILKFQEKTNHQFLITGRYFLPQVIDDFFGGSENVLLGRIQLMNRSLQENWIKRWSLAISNKTMGEEFGAFLYGSKDDDGSIIQASCPKDITTKLAGEPLSIFLLASLFQVNEINKNDFLIDDGFDGRVKVYQHVLDQTLKKVVKSKNRNSNNTITSEFLESVLMKAAAYYIQADGQVVDIAEINKEFKETKTSDLYRLLASFYVRPKKLAGKDTIEFTHKSFGEFLFAKYIKTLLSLCTTQPNKTKAISEDIYQALGSGLLTNEVLYFFVALSRKDNHLNSDPKNFLAFFYKLFDYYWDWCEGSYVEFPRIAIRTSGKYNIPTENITKTRHHYIYVGLNFILLTLELYRYLKNNIRFSQVSFHFCEKPNDYQSKDEEKLLRVIGFTYLLKEVKQVGSSRQNFVGAIGDFLCGIDLSGINLQGVDLSNANFCGSILKGSVLSNTNLSGANFMFSDLSGADLSGCNLEGAKIKGANLSDAILARANLGNLKLKEAYILSNTDMTESDRESLKKINFDFDSLNLQGKMNFENLKGIILDSVSLSNFNFEGISLREASLSNLVLDGANFKNADLRGANLQNVSLQNANLQNVKLQNADLRNANFRHSNLQCADLRKAITINTTFKEANLQQTIFSVEEDEVIEEEIDLLVFWWKWHLKIQDKGFLEIEHFNLWFTSLIYIESVKTIVELNDCFDATDFSRTNLERSNFEGLDLSKVDFEGANLRYTNLRNTVLEGALFSGADLSGANLEGAYFGITDLRGVKLRGAQLEGTVLKGLNYNLLAASTFLSHSIANKSLVATVAQQLGRRGVLSWLNKKEIGLDSFEGSLKEAIQLQVTITIFLSEAALDSSWCKGELRQVIEADEGREHLLPVYLDDPIKLVNAHDFLQTKFISASDGFINEPSFLSEDSSTTPSPEAIADKIAKTVYQRSIPEDWSEIAIVLDQRGNGLRRGSPVLPVNFKNLDIPTFTFRSDSGLRQSRETLSGNDWEDMVETMTKALSTALGTVCGHTRKVRVLGQAQTGLMWAVGRCFDRTTSAELYGYDKNGFEISNKGQIRYTPLPGGNADRAKPVLDMSIFSTSQDQVALGIGSPRYTHAVEQAVPDLPLFWIESGHITNSEQAMQLVADIVASVERFRDEYGAQELVLFWTTANHVALLAAANLTTHVIPKLKFMEWDHAQSQYVHLPMPGE